MRISDVYFIIISRKDYFVAEEKRCLFFFLTPPLQIPGRASKNDIAFCVSLEKKNTGPKNHTAGLFNFLNC